MSGNREVTYAVDFRAGRRRNKIASSPRHPPDNETIGCSLPRIARLLALAIRFEGLLREETMQDYAELARLGRVSRARMTQIMKLLDLAPEGYPKTAAAANPSGAFGSPPSIARKQILPSPFPSLLIYGCGTGHAPARLAIKFTISPAGSNCPNNREATCINNDKRSNRSQALFIPRHPTAPGDMKLGYSLPRPVCLKVSIHFPLSRSFWSYEPGERPE